jgi:hypothetical protein
MSTKAPAEPTSNFEFPEAPTPASAEWPGTPIGASNTITRTKSRTAVFDKNLDADPQKRARLLARAAVAGGDTAVRTLDVVIHGIRVRAITNSPHLYDFWRENWYGVEEWQRLTGNPASAEPRCIAYALTGVEDEPEAAYYSREANTIIFFNTAYYGQLKSWVLGAVGRVLAEEYGIHSIHGACVALDQRGILYIAPTGTGKSTSSYGLMQAPGARFHSDDWVYIRYMYPTIDGRLIAPTRIETADGAIIQGYRCARWLEQPETPEATVSGLGVRDEPLSVPLAQIDRSQPPAAYAYLSEKIFYLRSNLVENFPEAAYQLLQAKLENVPTVRPSFIQQHQGLLHDLDRYLLSAGAARGRDFFAQKPEAERHGMLARFFAFNNARAMLSIGEIFPPEQVFLDPLEPVRLTHVFLLKRDFADDMVLQTLDLHSFIDRLLIGLTPDGKHEIAYNAYRAVDDAEEAAYVAALEDQARQSGASLYAVMEQQDQAPGTLYQEVELFRQLHRAAGCYDLNTILEQDPAVTSRKQAVERTIALIGAVVSQMRGTFSATLSTYARLVKPMEP